MECQFILIAILTLLGKIKPHGFTDCYITILKVWDETIIGILLVQQGFCYR